MLDSTCVSSHGSNRFTVDTESSSSLTHARIRVALNSSASDVAVFGDEVRGESAPLRFVASARGAAVSASTARLNARSAAPNRTNRANLRSEKHLDECRRFPTPRTP